MHDISIVIGTGEAVTNDANDPFGGVITGITSELRNSEAKNLLNFSLDGEVLGYNKAEDGTIAADATPNKKYTIDINADINPFELLPLVDALAKNEDGSIGFNMSKEDMMAMVEKVGYLNITINEVNIEDDSLVKNLITIHSNFKEGMAIAAINLPDLSVAGLLTANLQIGGVYDFEGIYDVVAGLIANASATTKEAASTEADPNTGIDIMGILKDILACVDFDNMAEDGISLDADKLVDTLIATILGADNELAPTVTDAVMGLLGSDVLNVKATAGFQTCTEDSKVVTSELVSWIATHTKNEEGEVVTSEQGAYIVEVTAMDEGAAFPKDENPDDGVIRYPEGQMFGFANYNNSNRQIPLVGKTITGEEIHFYGYIVGTNMPGGLYPETGTYENPVFYIGLSNEFNDTILALNMINFRIEQGWPVSGIIPFQYDGTVEIVALSENATIENTLDNSVYTENVEVGDNAFTFAVGGNTAVITITVTDSANNFTWTNQTKTSGWMVLDSEGNDVSDTAIAVSGSFIKNYKWAQSGDFTVIVYAGALSFEYQVTVTEA